MKIEKEETGINAAQRALLALRSMREKVEELERRKNEPIAVVGMACRFPGGADSVRGYQEGEASPLDPNGAQLGAETYTQVNLELEQLLTRSWSIVVFFDGVGFAESRTDYPWNEGLFSIGGGIHWRTIVGPVRLEYGYNLDPRPQDPTGTLHFSIGTSF